MPDSTTKQHYVWRHYLAPWTSNGEKDGQIFCLMDNKIFSAGLMKIGNQRYFYKVPDLTERQIHLAKLCNELITKDSALKKANEKWIEVFQLALTTPKQSPSSEPTNEISEYHEFMRNNAGEIYHTKIEHIATKQLDLLKLHN